MPGFRLRPVANLDAIEVTALIYEILREYGLQPDPEGADADLKDLEQSYAARGGRFDVLAGDRGQLVGTVGIYRLDDATCELRKMYLRRECRGRGLGRFLLEHALRQARMLRFQRMTLETASVLRDAIALYERYGFRRAASEHLCCRCDLAMVLEFG